MKFVRVPQPRVPSGKASQKTIQLRTQCLESVRQFITAGDTSIQLESEVRACSPEDRQKLLGDLLKGGLYKVEIPADVSLAMKADLGLPWNKVRVITR